MKLIKKMRVKFRDSLQAFPFRMGGGFAGDVNRTHPASIEPALVDATAPPLTYGIPAFIDATSHNARQAVAGDGSATAAFVYGFFVRPFPLQPAAGATDAQQGLGAVAPPASNTAVDIMRSGYIMGKMNVGAVPVKGGAVFVWCAATSGAHIQGQLESAANSTNTLPLQNCFFNGLPDANNVVEVSVGV